MTKMALNKLTLQARRKVAKSIAMGIRIAQDLLMLEAYVIFDMGLCQEQRTRQPTEIVISKEI